MHIYTIYEVCKMVERLMNEGMSLQSAVNSTSAAYGYDTDTIYTYMTKHNIAGQGHITSNH